jgi:hypothetical protein
MFENSGISAVGCYFLLDGIMRRIDVLAARCLELAAKGKSNLVDVTVAEAAIRDCAEALL